LVEKSVEFLENHGFRGDSGSSCLAGLGDCLFLGHRFHSVYAAPLQISVVSAWFVRGGDNVNPRSV
jgi:hypothetical protein